MSEQLDEGSMDDRLLAVIREACRLLWDGGTDAERADFQRRKDALVADLGDEPSAAMLASLAERALGGRDLQ